MKKSHTRSRHNYTISNTVGTIVYFVNKNIYKSLTLPIVFYIILFIANSSWVSFYSLKLRCIKIVGF